MKKAVLICLALLLCSCSSLTQEPTGAEVVREVVVTQIVEVPKEIEVTRVVEVVVTKEVVVTEIVEREVVVTATPRPAPREFFYIEGNGNKVTDNYEWGVCDKAVFTWTADGRGNFIVLLCKVGMDDCRHQINEIGPDSGEFLQPILGGEYYFYIERGPADGWTIKGECMD